MELNDEAFGFYSAEERYTEVLRWVQASLAAESAP